MLTGLDFLIAGLAAIAAGAVNALAGGGTLITFPTLTFLGIPAIAANVTNTVALCPGYFGGTLAQRQDLRGQTNRLWIVVPASIVGGVVGGFLLLQTGERLFRSWSVISSCWRLCCLRSRTRPSSGWCRLEKPIP
jgi:uncharacterized membrane protein YfcA